MDGGYLFALFVTLEQENAIRSMFTEKGWTLLKADLCTDQQRESKLLTNIFEPTDKKVTDSAYSNEISCVNGGDTDDSDSSKSDHETDTDDEITQNKSEATSLDNATLQRMYNEGTSTEERISNSKNQIIKSNDKLQSLISRGKLLTLSNKHKVTGLNQSNKSRFSRNSKRYICKKRPIYCGDCKITFTSQTRFDKHKERNGGQCVFECEFCDKVFLYRKSRYDLHIRSAHSKERPFTCDVCGKGYVTSDKLKIHKRLHTGEKPCVCEECGKTFYSRGDLAVHRDYHHAPKEEDIQCNICSMTFCSKRYLLYHKKVTHSSVRDFHCPKCTKSFKCNSSLKRHLKYIHSENKEFDCKTCNKSFKTAGSLKKHLVRHSGERTFFCNECNKGFYENFKLLQHYRTHTGEKPYKCDLCDYKCALSGNLNKHKKTHYKELTNAVL